MEINKIRCKICGVLKKGAIIRHYNLKVCFDCFPHFFTKRVQETIEKFKMFTLKDSILIGISGGKDSMSITKVLKNLGYNVKAVHINTGIEGISEKSEEIVYKFCKSENIPLKIINLRQEIKASLVELSKISKKEICAICGMFRRYLLNREATEQTIVTGHTLNDEGASIFKNMLFWNDDLLLRIYPVLDEKEGLSKKVKPLCFITEEETKLLCEILNIKYIDEPCPYKSKVYEIFKKIVNELNEKFPGSIIGFYKGFLKRVKNSYLKSAEKVSLQRCEKCGYLTTSELCSICRLKAKLVQ